MSRYLTLPITLKQFGIGMYLIWASFSIWFTFIEPDMRGVASGFFVLTTGLTILLLHASEIRAKIPIGFSKEV